MKTAVGLFDPIVAGRVIDDLSDMGLSKERMSVIAHEPTIGAPQGPGDLADHIGGLHTATMTGVGRVFVAGPLGDMFAGADLYSSLIANGLTELEAKRYVDEVNGGSTMLAAEVDDAHLQQALDLMAARGHGRPSDIAYQQYQQQTGYSGIDTTATGTTTTSASQEGGYATREAKGEEIKVPIVKEEMHVGKREVESGGVRLTKTASEQPVEEPISLHQEKVTVERRPVDRPVEASDQSTGESSFEMRERREEPVVEKSSRVVEEVIVHKEATDKPETIRGTLRQDDVSVDALESEATRYGGDLRQQGAGEWKTIESGARSDWEKNRPGTWEKIKASVRRAFEKK